MASSAPKQNKSISLDWFVQGVLTKLGHTLDRFAGRGWKPSSSLATSELIERLKKLVDMEAREGDDKRIYVPHNITLKMQWDKFSTDSENALKTLEVELLTALVDHINDRRYYTYSPLSLRVKQDYFTTGVKLYASFDSSENEEQEASVDVTVPNLKIDALPEEAEPDLPVIWAVSFRYEVNGRQMSKTLDTRAGDRLSVGRTKENDIVIDDTSVSKLHASLRMSPEGTLVVADTGSTNGTFVNGERIAYGKAVTVMPGKALRFGVIDVAVGIERTEDPSENPETAEPQDAGGAETYEINGFEFTSKPDETAVEGENGENGAPNSGKTMILSPLPGNSERNARGGSAVMSELEQGEEK